MREKRGKKEREREYSCERQRVLIRRGSAAKETTK